MVRQIARAGAGGLIALLDASRLSSKVFVVCGPAVNTREVLDAAGLVSLVDEVEITEVEMTHD